jgi:hypothetical protein
LNSKKDKRPYRVAIWCAVSSKVQAADDKVSLDAQEQAGREFAEAIGGHVVAVYTVPGHSRDIIFWDEAEREMEAYRRLREDATAGGFDVLHAIDPDRLGRDPALSNQVVSLVEKSDAEVYFASNPHVIGQKGTGNRYVFAIQSTRAGEDQRRRVANLKRGMRKRRERGLHANNWPYGYKPALSETGQVVGGEFDEDQIGGMRLITERFLEGIPYRHIARELDASPYRPPRSTIQWDSTTVKRMLENPFYAGYPRWSGTTSETKSDKYPILWDDKTYAAVRKELEYRDRRYGRRTHTMLSGIVFCARCGKAMHRTRTGFSEKIPAWRCSSRSRWGTCHSNHVHESAILDALLTYLRGVLDIDAIDIVLDSTQDRAAQLQQQIAEIDQHIERVNQKRQRLALALASGSMDVSIYRKVDDQLLEEQEKLRRNRNEAKAELNTVPDKDARRESIVQVRNALDRLLGMPPVEANAMLRRTGIRVYCEHRTVTDIRFA